jgi:integrase
LSFFADIFSKGIWEEAKGWNDEHLRDDLERLKTTVLSSRAAGTTDTYRRAFLRWKRYTVQYEHMEVLPASPLDVAIYLQSLMDCSSSASTIDTAFYAIQWAHTMAGVESPTGHPVVVAVRDAASRHFGKQRNNRKSPLTAVHLQNLVDQSDLNNLLSLRNVCVFVLAFAGFFRIEEVLNLKRNNIRFIDNGVIINVESSKTDQLRVGDEVVISRIIGSDTCPVSILEKYLSLAHINSFSEEFLFRPLSKTGKGHRLVKNDKPISYTTIREAFKSCFKSIVPDIQSFSTHSLRAGGATAAANAGIGDRVFQRHGRWKSVAAKDGYVLDDISARAAVSKSLGL